MTEQELLDQISASTKPLGKKNYLAHTSKEWQVSRISRGTSVKLNDVKDGP